VGENRTTSESVFRATPSTQLPHTFDKAGVGALRCQQVYGQKDGSKI